MALTCSIFISSKYLNFHLRQELLGECKAVGRKRKFTGSWDQTNTIDSCLCEQHERWNETRQHGDYVAAEDRTLVLLQSHVTTQCALGCELAHIFHLSNWVLEWIGDLMFRGFVCGWWPHGVNREIKHVHVTICNTSAKQLQTNVYHSSVCETTAWALKYNCMNLPRPKLRSCISEMKNLCLYWVTAKHCSRIFSTTCTHVHHSLQTEILAVEGFGLTKYPFWALRCNFWWFLVSCSCGTAKSKATIALF